MLCSKAGVGLQTAESAPSLHGRLGPHLATLSTLGSVALMPTICKPSDR